MLISIQSMLSLLIQFPPSPKPTAAMPRNASCAASSNTRRRPAPGKSVAASLLCLTRSSRLLGPLARSASARASARRWPCCTWLSASTSPRCCSSSSCLVLSRWIDQLPLLMLLIRRKRGRSNTDQIGIVNMYMWLYVIVLLVLIILLSFQRR